MLRRKKLGKCIVDSEGKFRWYNIESMMKKTNNKLSSLTYANINYRKNIMLSKPSKN